MTNNTPYTLLCAPYVLVIGPRDKILVRQSLLVNDAVSKFARKCTKIGYVPNIVDGRIML